MAWTWCIYLIKTGTGEKWRTGWFWRSWAINSRPRFGPFAVTHVPTGYGVPWTFAGQLDARRFCEEIDSLADWSAVTIENTEVTAESIPVPLLLRALRRGGLTVTPQRFKLSMDRPAGIPH